ncbi:FAD-binding domain-containing protein [Pedobacter sp. SL55]|uniref:FAD-binding domain-containing protein n=1 Tax=Pedobacter sp. SL55 TaxID=2995161 RepID=UPI00226F7590|nr:FAD-binding domain-containing protein [Pedobacter sp. SL55]WAC39518.1 hypothetical protein OVA16_13080 [Pedobacter sp. SL55]
MFTTNYQEILTLIDQIDPVAYGKTRNYTDGAVTRLSPYISRGVISTRMIASTILKKGYDPSQIESFLKELAWRDYFQQVWIEKGNEIDQDLKQPQPKVSNYQMPLAITTHSTTIEAVDYAISQLYSHGYMHNHIRMYTASICCNLRNSHWLKPAKWMYYHLLDADWASNALSWQWVAGSFSNKKYFANQENINKFCKTNQTHTFLDGPYEAFEHFSEVAELNELTTPSLKTKLPEVGALQINENLPTCIYNFYNLDNLWLNELDANRILLLAPSFFEKYPVSNKTIDFVMQLATNIKNIQYYVGEFETLEKLIAAKPIHYKEHPTNVQYRGNEHQRDWMFKEVKGYFPSFFAYWKTCSKLSLDA